MPPLCASRVPEFIPIKETTASGGETRRGSLLYHAPVENGMEMDHEGRKGPGPWALRSLTPKPPFGRPPEDTRSGRGASLLPPFFVGLLELLESFLVLAELHSIGLDRWIIFAKLQLIGFELLFVLANLR